MTTYAEYYSKVLVRLNRNDGLALMAAQQAVNDARKVICRVRDFDNLKTRDTTSCTTVAETMSYHLIDDWGLTRFKDIITFRLMDGSNSRKLVYKTPRWLDQNIPYPEDMGYGKPSMYTQRGYEIDLIRIPDDEYSLYLFYSRWPAPLSDDDDEEADLNYPDLEDVIITLGERLARAQLNNVTVDAKSLTAELLSGAYQEDVGRPDQIKTAQPFTSFPTSGSVQGEWWKRAFTRRDP